MCAVREEPALSFCSLLQSAPASVPFLLTFPRGRRPGLGRLGDAAGALQGQVPLGHIVFML